MTKILIGTIAGSVLAVGISVGLVIGVLTKKDDKKPRTTRETTIETTERHARYPDDETEYPTEPEETETTPKETEPTQRITEDSIYIGMDGMSAEEVVNNVWKTTRVKVGMTKEEYASKFVLNGKNSKANSVVDGYYWQFVLIPSSKSRIMMLTLSVPRDKQTSEITSIHDKCFVETQLSIDGVDFSKEVFEKFLEKYKSVGFKVVDDFGPTDKMPARLVILERPGFRLKISLSCSSTYKKGTVSLQIPIVND